MRRLLIVTAFALVFAPALAAAAPQLVSYGDSGLKLGETSLFAKPVDGAAHDPAQELIWFRAAGTLYVIDLRDVGRKPVVIATRFPEGGFSIGGVSDADHDITYAGIYPILVVGKSPKIRTGLGAYGGMWEEQDAENKKAIRKIKLTGKKWLTKQAKRVARPVNFPEVGTTTDGISVPLAAKGEDCDGGGLDCGQTAPFGDTPYQLVVISSSCGDACHASCLFYDQKTKKFANPAATSTWSATIPPDTGTSCFPENYGLRPGGEYFHGPSRCKVATTGVTCTASEGWTHVGWVE